MKKIFTLIIIFSYCFSSFAFSAKDKDSAFTNLCKEIMFSQPQSYTQEGYAELAYLKRNFNLPKIKIDDSSYLSKITSNFYFDKYYLYSKFLKEDAIVTEDCLHIQESTEGIHKANKLLFYTLYPNSIKLPNNIIDQIEEYSTLDEFFGPYKMLNTIYYLKKYNNHNLSKVQKEKLSKLEKHLSELLFTKYIINKPWSFHRLLSLKVLLMNNNSIVKDVDITQVVDYFISNKPLYILDEDRSKTELFTKIGLTNIIQQQGIAILWIFLLEFK